MKALTRRSTENARPEMQDQFHIVILIEKKLKKMCCALYYIYISMECIDNFVTAVVTSAFNRHISNEV